MESNDLEMSSWRQLVERTRNFYGDYDVFLKEAPNNKKLFLNLVAIIQSVDAELGGHIWVREEQILQCVFSRLFDLLTVTHDSYYYFKKGTPFYNNVFDACFFTSLCMFIHHTKRTERMSITQFIDKQNPDRYKNEVKSHYDVRGSDNQKFRKMRTRLLSQRPVCIKYPEWAAMSEDSTHEWALSFILEDLKPELQDTYKRLGNLNNEINRVLNSPQNKDYSSEMNLAYKKFSSKLSKIKYENLLELQKSILEHILVDKDYYGMNLYRFENLLGLYNMVTEVKNLLESQDPTTEVNTLAKYVILQEIPFSLVYQDFRSVNDLDTMANYASVFSSFQEKIVLLSLLIFDALIDDGLLRDWKKLFLNKINGMAEKVIYNPQKIDFTIAPGSQEKYKKLISAPVKFHLAWKEDPHLSIEDILAR